MESAAPPLLLQKDVKEGVKSPNLVRFGHHEVEKLRPQRCSISPAPSGNNRAAKTSSMTRCSFGKCCSTATSLIGMIPVLAAALDMR